MLDRIEMNVIRAAFEIRFVPDGMLPKALLPKRVFTSMVVRDRRTSRDYASREGAFDPLPTA